MTVTQQGPRLDIANSWLRTRASGLDPASAVDPEVAEPVDPGSRLLQAAAPVLDDLAAALEDSAYTVILADREARLVDLRAGRRSLLPKLEGVGAVVGRPFTESTTGTNSIATAFETRRGISVLGEEHYLESFKRFACYGTPITDPLTGRIAGVLDITCLAEHANELLKPFLVRGVRDIEARLLAGARRSQRSLFEAFQRASQGAHVPVLGFGRDVLLSNGLAADTLHDADHAALQLLAAEAGAGAGAVGRRTVELSSGSAVVVLCPVDGGTLVRVEVDDRAPVPRRRAARLPSAESDWHAGLSAEIAHCRDDRISVLISGEPGSGCSTVAGRIVPAPTVRISCAEPAPADLPASGSWLIEDVHLLDAPTATALARLADRSGAQLVLTAAGPLPSAALRLAARCPVRVELTSLRAARDRIPRLATSMLSAGSGARFTPQALRVLAAQPWPGNLRELRTVVADVASRRSSGDVTPADLPAGYRDAGRQVVAGSLWQAERDAIVEALRTCGGNKAHAAQKLGIGRNTLYRRMRAFGL